MRKFIPYATAVFLALPISAMAQSEEKKVTCAPSNFQKEPPQSTKLIARKSTSEVMRIAHRARTKGFIMFNTIVFAWFDQDGRIFKARLRESSGYPELESAIVDYIESERVSGKCGVGLIPFGIAPDG